MSLALRVARVAVLLQLVSGAPVACHDRAEVVESHETDAFEYQRPIADVWPLAVAVAKDKGFDMPPSPSPDVHAVTSTNTRVGLGGNDEILRAKWVKGSFGGRYQLQLWLVPVQGADAGALTETGFGIRSSEIELAVIQRAEPARAAKIIADGAKSGAKRAKEDDVGVTGVAAAEGCYGCARCGR